MLVSLALSVLSNRTIDLHQDALVCRPIWRLRNVGLEVIGLFVSPDGLAFMLHTLIAAFGRWIGRHFDLGVLGSRQVQKFSR